MSDMEVAPEQLRALLLEHLHVDVPSADTDLLETGLLDSLQLVELLLLIEQHFGRRIPIESIELESLRSLSRLARLLLAPGAIPAAEPESADREAAEPAALPDNVRPLRRRVGSGD